MTVCESGNWRAELINVKMVELKKYNSLSPLKKRRFSLFRGDEFYAAVSCFDDEDDTRIKRIVSALGAADGGN